MSLQKLTIFRSFSSQACIFKFYPKQTPARNRALVESIAETPDQRSFLAWHPKKDFPYEFTRPLPSVAAQVNESLLKDEMIEAAKRAYRLNTPNLAREKLCQMTFTTKHRWFPRSRDRKAKKTPMDRTYL